MTAKLLILETAPVFGDGAGRHWVIWFTEIAEKSIMEVQYLMQEKLTGW